MSTDPTKLPAHLPGHWDTAEGREMAMRYADVERPALHLGSDLHLANAAYMELHEPLGTGTKERMRWLSVQLALAAAERDRLAAENTELAALLKNARNGAQAWIKEADRLVAAKNVLLEAAKKLDQWSLVIKDALRGSNDLKGVTAAIDGVRQALAHHSAPVEPFGCSQGSEAWPDTTPTSARVEDVGGLVAYDTGLMGDYGGGNVEWWHDYIRAELDRAHDHYAAQLVALIQPQGEERDADPGEYPPPCSDPGGHSWVCRDDNEEISYCEHCGADGNA